MLGGDIMKNKKAIIIFGIFLILGIGIATKFLISQNEKTIHKRFKDYVVFYPQHQDDESLWGGSAIVNAIKECGPENVYVVLVSDGSGVNVFRQNPRFKGISRKEKETLRNNEFKAALNQLGVRNSNIIILADEAKKPGTHYDLMEKTILKFEKEFGSVTQIAHHYRYDNHPMHRKNGKVLKKLSDEHKVADARYFIKPAYVNDIPKDKRDEYIATTQEDKEKVKGALDEYKYVDEKAQRFGIGYTSTHKYFDHLYNDQNYTSVLSYY
jgi:LmbE family N-acetylglucosaminyl deacetylase